MLNKIIWPTFVIMQTENINMVSEKMKAFRNKVSSCTTFDNKAIIQKLIFYPSLLDVINIAINLLLMHKFVSDNLSGF